MIVLVGNTQDVIVPGTSNQANKVSVTVTPIVTVTISNVGGTVCLGGPGVACTGPSGVTAEICDMTTTECICPAQCAGFNYGKLMRGACLAVSNGDTFNSGSGTVEFFVNGDCNPGNNSGSFNLTLSY